jgi:hypothetical protein
LHSWTHTHQGARAAPGYTYDAVLNGMLLGKLRLRLDRAFYCARAPDEASAAARTVGVTDCEIVGAEPIRTADGAPLVFTRPTARGDVQLPVFPSVRLQQTAAAALVPSLGSFAHRCSRVGALRSTDPVRHWSANAKACGALTRLRASAALRLATERTLCRSLVRMGHRVDTVACRTTSVFFGASV